MPSLANYDAAEVAVVKLFAYSLRSAPTNDLVQIGASFIEGGGSPAALLNVLFNADIPNSPFDAYAAGSTDAEFMAALVENLTWGIDGVSQATKDAWAESLAPLVALFPTRGDAALKLATVLETNTSTDPELMAIKAGLLARAETAAEFAQSPAGATYDGTGFDQFLAPLQPEVPTYAVAADVDQIHEGGTITYTLTTTGVPEGTVINFSLGGTGITADDVEGGSLNGSFTVGADGKATATVQVAADVAVEGIETLRLELANGAAHADVVVNDTSTGPVPTFALSAGAASADEGTSITYTLTTTHVAAGTVIPFTLSGTGITAADIASGSLTGAFTVNEQGVATVTILLAADATTEGVETLRLQLQNTLAQVDVAINDSSVTPPPTGTPDTVVIANQMDNSQAHAPATPAEGEITVGSYLSYDLLNQSAGTPVRMSLDQLRATSPTAGAPLNPNNSSADRGNIPQVSNQGLFTFDLGFNTDRVDYSAETGKIVALVGLTGSNDTQYVLVNDDGTDDVFNGATDRIDFLRNVEEVVASAGGGVLDLTNAQQNLALDFSHNFDAATDVDAAKDRAVHRVLISDLDGGTPLARSYLEYRDAGQDAGMTQAAALWTRIEGSDRDESVTFSSAEAVDARTLNLRGGENSVHYNELTRSIRLDLSATAFAANTNPAADGNGSGVVTGVVRFTDGNGATLAGSSQHTITSYGADHGVAGGLLRVSATQDAEDEVRFAGDALAKRISLGQTAPGGGDQVEVRFAGTAATSIALTGFERLVDNGGSDDLYAIANLATVAAGSLKLVDSDGDLAVQAGFAQLGAPVVAAAAAVDFAAGLDLTGAANYGVVFNKAGAVTAADIANAAAAGKIALEDNGTAIVLASADADGMADGNNEGYTAYLIKDTDAGAGQTYTVTSLGMVHTSAEVAASTLAGGTLGGLGDHDGIAVQNDAVGSAPAGSLANGIKLASLSNAFGIDFDVLDITAVTSGNLVLEGAPGTLGWGVDDELVVGALGRIAQVSQFESLVLTEASTDQGTALTLDLDNGVLRAGGTQLFTYGGSTLSANGLVHGNTGGGVAAVAAGLTINVIDSSAGAGATVWGGSGADVLTGGAGNDTLRGGAGNDMLDGGFTPAAAGQYKVTLSGGASVLGADGDNLTIAGVTITAAAAPAAFNAASASNQILTGADADQVGSAFAAVSLATWKTALVAAGASAAEANELLAVGYDGFTNVLTLQFSNAAAAQSLVLADFATGKDLTGGSITATEALTAAVARQESADTYVFEASAALNGLDTINNFNAAGLATDDTLDFSAFLGGAANVAGAAADFQAAGLDLSGAANAGVVFNKAVLAASDIQATAAAGKIALENNGKAVVLATADADGMADAANTGYNVYFIEDTDAGAGINYNVYLVGTVHSAAELNAADLLGAIA